MDTNVLEAKCVECGGTFPFDDMIRHGAVHVCANCKPVFMQKLVEGAQIDQPRLRYAGFWRRFLAVLIDSMIFGVLNVSILLIGLPFGNFGILLSYIARGLYEVILVGSYGATVGKTVCQIRVVTADGGRVSYGLALGRYFAKILSGVMLGIGFLMAAFDDEKRSLHDRICNTRVVMG